LENLTDKRELIRTLRKMGGPGAKKKGSIWRERDRSILTPQEVVRGFMSRKTPRKKVSWWAILHGSTAEKKNWGLGGHCPRFAIKDK